MLEAFREINRATEAQSAAAQDITVTQDNNHQLIEKMMLSFERSVKDGEELKGLSIKGTGSMEDLTKLMENLKNSFDLLIHEMETLLHTIKDNNRYTKTIRDIAEQNKPSRFERKYRSSKSGGKRYRFCGGRIRNSKTCRNIPTGCRPDCEQPGCCRTTCPWGHKMNYIKT